MPLVRTALIAAVASLLGSAAFAQTDTTDTSAQPPPGPPPAAAPTGAPENASATVDSNGVQVIASQPVPDTKANRAAYGQPLSRAGKRTAPKGN